MTSLQAFIKQHALLSYFVLVFAISFGGALIVVGPGGFPITIDPSSPLFLLAMLAFLLGPALAGPLMAGLFYGRAGLRELLSRLLRWRVGFGWYAVALLTAPLVSTAVALALSLRSPAFLPVVFTADDKVSPLLMGMAMGLVVGIFEELGWTGFAIPRLRQRYGVLATGFLLGLPWGAWHFLMFWESDSFSGPLPLAILLVRLFSWLPAYRVLMVWVYDRTESLPVAMLMHASLTAISSIFAAPTTGTDLLLSLLVGAAAWWAVVAVVTVANHGHLSRPAPRRQMA